MSMFVLHKTKAHSRMLTTCNEIFPTRDEFTNSCWSISTDLQQICIKGIYQIEHSHYMKLTAPVTRIYVGVSIPLRHLPVPPIPIGSDGKKVRIF